MGQLLIELFSEEIPAGLQKSGAKNLETSFSKYLNENGLKFGESQVFWSPMRLVLCVEEVSHKTEDIYIEKRGPRIDAKKIAVIGFAKSFGVSENDLIIQETPKGEFYFYKYKKHGEDGKNIIKEAIKTVILKFPWSKSMRWGKGDLRWIRPLHSILCLFEKEVIDFNIDGINSGNFTFGHRFVSPDKIIVNNKNDYINKLKNANVLVNSEERSKIIISDGQKLSKKYNLNFKPLLELVEEVVNIVEYPYLFIGEFDKEYLSLPEEILKLTMMKQQKYFPLLNKNKTLSNKFIGVSNIPVNGKEIISGNSKVLRARLSDARFFYNNDIKKGLKDYAKNLNNIIFHRLLGTMEEKVERIKGLIKIYGNNFAVDMNLALISAELAKADLCSEVVYEMPELQGIIGSRYAEAEGLDKKVVLAIKEHYSPVGPSDKCPSLSESSLLAFTDKLDSLVGFMAIDLKPTGSKDPFGIRRSSLGIIRIILENNIRIFLSEVIADSYYKYSKQNYKLIISKSDCINISINFLIERLKIYLRDLGINKSCILSVCNLKSNDDIFDVMKRIKVLDDFIMTNHGKIFIQSLKRVRRILEIEEKKDMKKFCGKINTKLFKEKEEFELYKYFNEVNKKTESLLINEKYKEAMILFSKIDKKLEHFFEKVQVNDNEKKLRENRLNILSSIRKTFINFADFSLIDI